VNEWIARCSQEPREHGAASKSGQDMPGRGFNSTSIDSQYQRDRARIIHCASFRALQSKTQVLGLGESDFYRTRLTHSLEVAQIGSGICEWLRHNDDTPPPAELEPWIPSFSLIEAICLAHDIGHSPYGHGGEIALNYMMKDHGGFEANGQTLRIIAELGEFSATSGLDLTRRTQLGTIKYPVFYSEVVNYQDSNAGQDAATSRSTAAGSTYLNIDQWAPPKCLFDSNTDTMDWILAPFTEADRKQFRQINKHPNKHHRSQFKSFDTTIMELADDIAYGVHDLEDALALRLVDLPCWERSVVAELESMPGNPIIEEIDFYNRELFSESNSNRKHAISKLVGYFIRNIGIGTEEFEHPLLRYQASMQPEAYRILLALKRFVMDEVILRPELQALQFKGQQVIISLFEIFLESPDRLLPKDVYRDYVAREGDRRVIADYVAGMTDVSAGKLYHKLLTPTTGSIFDRT